MIWDVPGTHVGHWTDALARTGCTVVLFDQAVVASGEVRGGAPATREFAMLDPLSTVERIDAVVLSGGSAFGLAACDGVVAWCERNGRGFPTVAGRVPIVVGMALYDLAVGDPSVRPSAASGEAACADAPRHELGAVGAGCGATVGKWRGRDAVRPGGLVGATERRTTAAGQEVIVSALVAVNAWGDVVGHGAHAEPFPDIPLTPPEDGDGVARFGNTTIGVVATNAALGPDGCQHVARGAHDGLARAVEPPHASVDGDAFVAVATGQVDAATDLVRSMAVRVVDHAIRSLPMDR